MQFYLDYLSSGRLHSHLLQYKHKKKLKFLFQLRNNDNHP